jgi:hypothetical protein
MRDLRHYLDCLGYKVEGTGFDSFHDGTLIDLSREGRHATVVISSADMTECGTSEHLAALVSDRWREAVFGEAALCLHAWSPAAHGNKAGLRSERCARCGVFRAIDTPPAPMPGYARLSEQGPGIASLPQKPVSDYSGWVSEYDLLEDE